jgi:plastocyanin
MFQAFKRDMELIRMKKVLRGCLACMLIASGVAATELSRIQLIDLAGVPIPDAVVEYDAVPVEPRLLVTADYTMDQKEFQFTPRVLVVPLGALVRFPNGDESRHHVYSFSEARPFEIQLYAGNQSDPVDFPKNGVVALGCNIHDQMSAHIYVTAAEIAEVTDANGWAAIPAIQADTGSALTVWHPLMQLTQTFVVNELGISSSGEVTLTLPIALPQQDNSDAAGGLRNRLKSFKSQ